MANYLFIYHGGQRPESEEEMNKVMQAWGEWLSELGAAVVNGGNPVGQSHTLHSDSSVTHDGGPNPVSGYSMIEADSIDDALVKAGGCPILDIGGSIEIAEIMSM